MRRIGEEGVRKGKGHWNSSPGGIPPAQKLFVEIVFDALISPQAGVLQATGAT